MKKRTVTPRAVKKTVQPVTAPTALNQGAKPAATTGVAVRRAEGKAVTPPRTAAANNTVKASASKATADKKQISERKREANRTNAGKSTGPRTKRGKNTSRFNAVKTGLFAKHILITAVDGEDGALELRRLLYDLQKKFRPQNWLHNFYVEQLA